IKPTAPFAAHAANTGTPIWPMLPTSANLPHTESGGFSPSSTTTTSASMPSGGVPGDHIIRLHGLACQSARTLGQPALSPTTLSVAEVTSQALGMAQPP